MARISAFLRALAALAVGVATASASAADEARPRVLFVESLEGLRIASLDEPAFARLGVFDAAPGRDVRHAIKLNEAKLKGLDPAARLSHLGFLAGARLVVSGGDAAAQWTVYERTKTGLAAIASAPRPARALTSKVAHDWLRATLGYDGVVIRDDGQTIEAELGAALGAPGQQGIVLAGSAGHAKVSRGEGAPGALVEVESRRGARVTLAVRLRLGGGEALEPGSRIQLEQEGSAER